MTMPNWPVENRARTIAALPALGLKLPAAITKAIAAFEAAQEMRVPAPPAPGQPVRLALADTAIDLFAAAAERGAKTITLDPAPIARARTAEQEANDLAVLAREVKAAAATGLCQVCDEHYSAVLAALRAAYREHAAALIGHAKLIPPGTNDRAALDAGGALRTAYLAAEKAVAAIRQLQAALFEVADEPTPGPIPDRLEQALGFVRTPVVCDALLADGTLTWGGDLGSFDGYLGAARAVPDVDEWWLPTRREAADRADQIIEQRRAAKIKAAAG